MAMTRRPHPDKHEIWGTMASGIELVFARCMIRGTAAGVPCDCKVEGESAWATVVASLVPWWADETSAECLAPPANRRRPPELAREDQRPRKAYGPDVHSIID